MMYTPTCTCPCFIVLGGGGVCGNEEADDSLMSQNHKHSGSPCVYKPGGVPDKLCVFPAGES